MVHLGHIVSVFGWKVLHQLLWSPSWCTTRSLFSLTYGITIIYWTGTYVGWSNTDHSCCNLRLISRKATCKDARNILGDYPWRVELWDYLTDLPLSLWMCMNHACCAWACPTVLPLPLLENENLILKGRVTESYPWSR